MAHWQLGAIVFFLRFFLSHPQCIFCTDECNQLKSTSIDFVNISIICDHDANITKFVEANNLTNPNSIKLLYSSLLKSGLSNLSSAKIVDLSGNGLTVINVNIFHNVQSLCLSHNNLTQIKGNLMKLKFIDLSHNLISNISKCPILSGNVSYISLNNNLISSLNNFSSDTLEHFDLKNNKINLLSLNKFKKLKILDLSNNLIAQISANISHEVPKLEILNLSSNAIKTLDNYSFNLTNLLKLDLKNNKLKHLSPKCFVGLNKLQFLDISQNKLKTVFPSTLQYLSGLIQLIISENKDFSTQDFGLLLASKRLKSVNASNTNQKKIPSSLIRSVRYLFLSFNNITQIQCGDLDSYPLLNSLDLSHNNISYIEDDALGRLELLKTIILSYNFLISIPYTLPNNLKTLLINNNVVKKITTTDFSSIIQLKQLDLSNNRITTIAEGSFAQLILLQTLNLSGNNINILSSSIFTNQRNLKTLDLSNLNNVMKCDQVLCFPVPESNELQELILMNSPVLVNRLVNDAAALKTFKQLTILNLAYANLTELRNDLLNYFPRLKQLYLQGNDLNCTLLQSTYLWLEIKEVDDCIFKMNEIEVTTTIMTVAVKNKVSKESTVPSSVETNLKSPNTTKTDIFASTTKDFFMDFQFKNISEFPVPQKNEASNKVDIWYKESDLGVVDAFADNTPTSHPGLFILLVLPIALVSTYLCWAIHYSRSKRQLANEISHEMDIEISNISSELW
ncbi:nephrocan [Cimex lectularius]|uniref:Uncharacterized protein n=1 Tax=Cimex lectularius TaxID=79782 RepID=A0A8I6RHM1_CIMLE|nr:nephrocan [Cimex lectularius]XP_014246470.1 nephrocan [Cimex lectularius]